MRDVVLLQRGFDDWYCPNGCFCTDRTLALPPNSSRYHNCPKLHGLNAPLVRVGTDCTVEAVERQTYLGPETQATGDDGKPYMAVQTRHADGKHDLFVNPGVARVRKTD